MSVDGIGSFPVFGVSGVGSSRAATERRNRRETESATADPRAAFDAELQSMLGDAAPVGGAASPQAPQRRGDVRTPQQADADTYAPSRAAPATYNASGRLNGVVSAPVAGTDALASQPATVPAGAADSAPAGEDGEDSAAAKTPGELSKGEEEQVRELQQRDAEVRAHEQAHQATGGEHAGGASYTYQRGPDNRQYAVGGSVPIDVSPVPDDPEATVQKAEKVRAAAMAPASPSGQDQAVAAKASQLAAKARAEQAEEGLNPDKKDAGGMGAAKVAGSDQNADKSAVSGQDDAKSADSGQQADNPAVSGRITDKSADSAQNDTQVAASSQRSGKDAEQAAASGLTSLRAESLTESRPAEQTHDTSREAAKLGVGGALPGQPLAAASASQARPTESVEAMDPARSSDSSRESQFSPAAQATRAAFTALNSLTSLHQSTGSTETAQNAQARPDAPSARAMNRAASAYARTRGETGLAPGGTGISMAV